MKEYMTLNENELNTIHDKCGWHEHEINNSSICGCFYCLKLFPPQEITEWLEESKSSPRGPGKTAICPHCGIDSVLPDSIGFELTNELLVTMNDKFF